MEVVTAKLEVPLDGPGLWESRMSKTCTTVIAARRGLAFGFAVGVESESLRTDTTVIGVLSSGASRLEDIMRREAKTGVWWPQIPEVRCNASLLKKENMVNGCELMITKLLEEGRVPECFVLLGPSTAAVPGTKRSSI